MKSMQRSSDQTRLHLIAAIGLIFIFAGCKAQATGDGVCERRCGSRTVGGGKLVAIPLVKDTTMVVSSCKSADISPFEVHYMIYEDTKSAEATTTEGATSAIDSARNKQAKRIPKAGIAFYPSVIGKSKNQIAKGVLTPEADWCTDSCGIASLVVQPSCEAQLYQVGVVVPGLTGESADKTGIPFDPFILTIKDE